MREAEGRDERKKRRGEPAKWGREEEEMTKERGENEKEVKKGKSFFILSLLMWRASRIEITGLRLMI